MALPLFVAVPLGSCASMGPAPTAQRPAGPTLANLDVLVTIGGGGKLTPTFSANTTEYSLNVHSEIFEIAVVANAADKSTGRITVNDKPAHSVAPAVVMVPVGVSKFKVAVSAASGASTTYTIAVTREDIQPIVDKFLKLTFYQGATVWAKLDEQAKHPCFVLASQSPKDPNTGPKPGQHSP